MYDLFQEEVCINKSDSTFYEISLTVNFCLFENPDSPNFRSFGPGTRDWKEFREFFSCVRLKSSSEMGSRFILGSIVFITPVLPAKGSKQHSVCV
jgi:hypothetical protein